MLVYLFEYLNELGLPGAGVFRYISFRASMALILSLFISTIIGKRIIDILRQKYIGETIRDLSIEGQMSKKDTPTMGGLIIIISILVPTILFAKLDNVYILLMIISTIWLGALGFADDYLKLARKNKEGLHGRFKIIAQIGLGLIVGLTMYMSPNIVLQENIEVRNGQSIENIYHSDKSVKSLKTTIPFMKDNNLDYGKIVFFMGDYADKAGWILFVIVVIFIITAVSNGANLTDGLDGLASGTSAIIGVTLAVLAYVSSHATFASYLNIMFIPGSEELVVFASTFIGATVGFLWYNAYPAQIFMGDTGSLTLGGIIAVFAILIHKELLLPLLCGIFLVESLSVILQVSFFKLTKKKGGKRIFKMTPLHHHFQKVGNAGIDAFIQKPLAPIPESKIVVRFWLIGIILAVLTLATLKIR